VNLRRRRRRDAPVPRHATWVAVGAGALLAVLVSVTRSFTQPAAVLVAISLLLLVATVVLQLLGDEPPALVARRATPAKEASAAAPRRAGWLVWATAIGAAVAWQLWNYVNSPRSDHPTISHLLDGLVHPAGIGRGAGFAIWLAVGWYLVTR
jgi:hypothetical protein